MDTKNKDSLKDLFKSLSSIKQENYIAEEQRKEKLQYVKKPEDLNVEKEINSIFDSLQDISNEIKNKQKQLVIAEQKAIEVIEQPEVENEVVELNGTKELTENKVIINEVEEQIADEKKNLINVFADYISKEENNKKEKRKLKEEPEGSFSVELDLIKKRISALATQMASVKTSSGGGGGGGGGEDKSIKKVYDAEYRLTGIGGPNVVFGYTELLDMFIILPNAISNKNWEVNIKKMDSPHNLTIRGYNTNQLIDGQVQQNITVQYSNYTLVCDGSNWAII